jgi:hypothetical protein
MRTILSAAGDIQGPANPSLGSANPELVEEHTPDRVVLIVTRAAGEQVDLIGDDGGNQDHQVGELAVEPRPQAGGRGGVGRLRGRGPGYLPVHGWIAELGRIGGGGAIG